MGTSGLYYMLKQQSSLFVAGVHSGLRIPPRFAWDIRRCEHTDSAVTSDWLRAGWPGSDFQRRQGLSYSSPRPDNLWGLLFLSNGYQGILFRS
jgi:hypothetical protein